jgi:hypothetical protein
MQTEIFSSYNTPINTDTTDEKFPPCLKLPYKVLPPIPKRAGFQYASINGGDLKQLAQETLKTLSTYAEEVIRWLRGT